MAEKNQFKITFVDDHVVLREALAKMVQGYEDCTILDSVNNGRELLDSIETGNIPDLVVLDLNMPIMDGYKCSEILFKNYPEIKILILTMYDTEIPLIRLLQDGIRGFVKKDIHPNEFKHALQNIIMDGYYYSYNCTAQLTDVLRKTSQRKLSLDKTIMNPLELEFLKYSASQYTYKEIAVILNVTARHIDNIRNTLFNKLGVKNRVGLAMYAVKNGLVPLSGIKH